ncbi:MAG: hypothetical protein ACREIA_21765 [Opitutaceae bacterium]
MLLLATAEAETIVVVQNQTYSSGQALTVTETIEASTAVTGEQRRERQMRIYSVATFVLL